MNCVQTNLFTPYLCHVNLLSLIMFKTNQPKETMKHKSIIPKNEYQSYKNDFDKEILNETNQPKETMQKQAKKKTMQDIKRENDIIRIDYNFFKIEDLDQQSFILRTILNNQNNDVLETLNTYIKSKI